MRAPTPIARILGVFLAILSISSCRIVEVYVGTARARNDYSRGEYQKSNRVLLQIRDRGVFEPWIRYNIGTVYYALGEPASALEVWSNARPEDESELAFYLEFNRGVLAYESGNFREAFIRFRRALELDPASIEAKVNIEFALEKLETRGEERSKIDESDSIPSEVERVLKYLERLEENVWESTKEIEQEEVPDW